MDKYFILWITINGDDWEREEKEVSFDREYLELLQKEFDEEHKKNGKYIPNIRYIHYSIEKYSDEQVRNILTVNEYLELNVGKQII